MIKLWPPPKHDPEALEIFVMGWAFLFLGIVSAIFGILEIGISVVRAWG